MNKPSEEFYNSILDSGCLVQSCDICGRTHFATSSPNHYEKEELERLQRNALANPVQFIEHCDSDTISCGEFNGQIIVYQCSPECEARLFKYEQFIIRERFMIAKFLNARAEKIKVDSKLDAKLSMVRDNA